MRGDVYALLVAFSSALACTPAHTAPAAAPANVAPDAVRAPSSLVGRWDVVGCETSPRDPADCARGTIEFTAEHVTIAVPVGPGTSRSYKVVSASSDHIEIEVDGGASEIVLDATGAAHWAPPGLGGRVGHLTFVRDRP